MKSALEQVSDKYESAKRERYEHRQKYRKDDPVLNERCYCWSEALAILQEQKGDFV
jgi:hypothetical protein